MKGLTLLQAINRPQRLPPSPEIKWAADYKSPTCKASFDLNWPSIGLSSKFTNYRLPSRPHLCPMVDKDSKLHNASLQSSTEPSPDIKWVAGYWSPTCKASFDFIGLPLSGGYQRSPIAAIWGPRVTRPCCFFFLQRRHLRPLRNRVSDTSASTFVWDDMPEFRY